MYLKCLLGKRNCAKCVAMHLTKFLLLHSPQLFAHRDRIIHLLKWRPGRGEGWNREHEREEMGWECCTMRSGIMGKTDRNLPFWFSTPIPHRPTLYPYISPLSASKKVQFYFNFFLSYYFLLSTFNNFISGRFSFTPSNNTTLSKPATTPLLTFSFLFFFIFWKPALLVAANRAVLIPMSMKSSLAIRRTFDCRQELGMRWKLLVEFFVAVPFATSGIKSNQN